MYRQRPIFASSDQQPSKFPGISVSPELFASHRILASISQIHNQAFPQLGDIQNLGNYSNCDYLRLLLCASWWRISSPSNFCVIPSPRLPLLSHSFFVRSFSTAKINILTYLVTLFPRVTRRPQLACMQAGSQPHLPIFRYSFAVSSPLLLDCLNPPRSGTRQLQK